MAKKWSEVAQSDAYRALAPEQQEAARSQYFDQVVAPQIGDPAQVQVARQQFDAQTKPKADFSNVQGGSRTTASDQPTGLARDIGMSARSVIQGVGGLVGAIGGDAFNHYLVPGDQPSYRDAAAGVADRLGLPAPRTSQERVMGDVGEALTGTGLTLGAGGLLNAGRSAAAPVAATVRGWLGDLLTAQPKLQAVSAATGAGAASATRESGGGAGAQLAAGLLGGLAPGATAATTAATARGLVRGGSGDQMRRTIADFSTLGATPSGGQAAGGWTQGLEGLLSRGPTSGGVMGRFAGQQSDDIARGLQSRADQLSPGAGSESAGLAIERGMQAFKGDTKAVKRALYWAVDRQIPGGSPTPMVNTRRTLAQLTTPNPAAPATTGAMVQPRIAQLRQNLESDLQANGGNLTYEALKRIRSDVGEAISGSSPLNPTSDLAELNKLYGALSDDMMAAAKASGPAAVKAAQRANKYTRDVANRMELVQRVLDKNGGPEKVFQAAMAGTNDGATTLRAVMYSLPVAEQKAVSAAVIKRMGSPTAGQAGVNAADEFSANTFLTNWNKLSPESRAVLFGRYGPGFKADMERIASVAENIKTGAKVYANPSGTADKGAAYGYWVALLGALGTGQLKTAGGVAGAGLLANGAARLFTAPWAVRWLAQSTALPVGSAVGQAQALVRLAEKNEDPEIEAVARALEEQARNQQVNAGAPQQ